MVERNSSVNNLRFFMKDVWEKPEALLIKTKKNDEICIAEGK